jgi:hypothetical protein
VAFSLPTWWPTAAACAPAAERATGKAPAAAHDVLTENTSRTEPAKLLVVLISNTGDKLKVDDPPK